MWVFMMPETGIMKTHRSDVLMNMALFTQVLHMDVQCSAIHLPLEFKKEANKQRKSLSPGEPPGA